MINSRSFYFLAIVLLSCGSLLKGAAQEALVVAGNPEGKGAAKYGLDNTTQLEFHKTKIRELLAQEPSAQDLKESGESYHKALQKLRNDKAQAKECFNALLCISKTIAGLKGATELSDKFNQNLILAKELRSLVVKVISDYNSEAYVAFIVTCAHFYKLFSVKSTDTKQEMLEQSREIKRNLHALSSACQFMPLMGNEVFTAHPKALEIMSDDQKFAPALLEIITWFRDLEGKEMRELEESFEIISSAL